MHGSQEIPGVPYRLRRARSSGDLINPYVSGRGFSGDNSSIRTAQEHDTKRLYRSVESFAQCQLRMLSDFVQRQLFCG